MNRKLAEDRKGYSSAQVSAQKTGANLGHQAYKSLILLGRPPPTSEGYPILARSVRNGGIPLGWSGEKVGQPP